MAGSSVRPAVPGSGGGTADEEAEHDLIPPPEQGVAGRSLRSGVWVFGRRISANVIRLGAIAILARHLNPADFGLVALAQVLLLFITVVGEAGVSTYVIYDREDGWPERAQAAFWLNFWITVVQVGICLLTLPLVARFFHQNQLRPVLAVLALVFFIDQMAMVPEALVQRELRHDVLARRDILTDIGAAALSVVLALAGWGVWSLVVPWVLLEPIRLVIALSLAQWRPRLPFRVRDWPRILRYTLPLMGTNFLGLIANDGDTLLVGRVLGSTPLGYYSTAWQLSNLVNRTVTGVVTNVALPALAKVSETMERLRAAYLRTLSFLSVVCFPALAGMFAVADDMIRVAYGPRWAPVVTLLRLFIVFTIIRSVTSPSTVVYNVTGRPDIGFKFSLCFIPPYLGAIVIGSHWGVVGVATAVMLVRGVGALITTYLSTRQLEMRFRTAIWALTPTACLSIAMAAVVRLAWFGLQSAGVGAAGRLFISVALGIVIYVAGLVIVKPTGYADVARIGRRITRRFRSSATV